MRVPLSAARRTVLLLPALPVVADLTERRQLGRRHVRAASQLAAHLSGLMFGILTANVRRAHALAFPLLVLVRIVENPTTSAATDVHRCCPTLLRADKCSATSCPTHRA